MTSLRLLLGVPAALWAMTAPAAKALKFYFAAQLFNLLIAELPYGYVSPEAYVVLYGVGLAAIMLATTAIVWDVVHSRWVIFFSCVAASVVEIAGIANITHWSIGAMAGLIEGGMLFSAATALALKVPFIKAEEKTVKSYFALVLLWFTLGIFDFAYAKGVPMTPMLNTWLRSFLVVGTLLYVGAKLRDLEWARP